MPFTGKALCVTDSGFHTCYFGLLIQNVSMTLPCLNLEQYLSLVIGHGVFVQLLRYIHQIFQPWMKFPWWTEWDLLLYFNWGGLLCEILFSFILQLSAARSHSQYKIIILNIFYWIMQPLSSIRVHISCQIMG